METTTYAFKIITDLSYDDAIRRSTEELKKEGFGVLTEIDVRETLKNKLGVDFPKYKILGACSPPNALKALQLETDIGLMLPCNVIVYEKTEGKTVVAAIDPVASMKAIENPGLKDHALEIQRKLQKVIDALDKSKN